MEVKKISLTLDEYSEIKVLLSRKIEELKQKCSKFFGSNKPVDKQLFAYWQEKLCTLKAIYSKIRCETSEVL